MNLEQVLEALLFASDQPLTTQELSQLLQEVAQTDPQHPHLEGKAVAPARVEEALAALARAWEEAGRAVELQKIAGGWQVRTRPEFDAWVQQLRAAPRTGRLSQPALETLAIIAYRQPVTRAEVEAIRGVAVDGVLGNLLERGWVAVAGRAEAPGRPQLYGTTPGFLEAFGLHSLEELPNVQELRQAGGQTLEARQQASHAAGESSVPAGELSA